MKRLYNRVIAFLLTIALVVPMLTAGVVPARAESITASNPGKPELFIDFLGDSIPAAAGQTATVPTPADTNRAYSESNPNGWKMYGPADSGSTADGVTPTVAGTVFWVGVGIDKMAAFQLAGEGKGLYGVELGFYYNSEFVEPYTGTDGQTFADVIASYNLGTGNTKNQWDDAHYRVAEALTDLAPVGDPASQDEAPPAGDNWRMTYVSIQKKDGDNNTSTNRFCDIETTNTDTQYIVMIPFILKAYDANKELCFKLVRNAGIFSIGGGRYGYTIRTIEADTSDYGAWEYTTRNTGHNLKQMFDFTGDLNIFTGEKVVERYDATLNLINISGTTNTASLQVKDDPFAQPITNNQDILTGLYPGAIMELDIKCDSGTNAQVTVTNPQGSTQVTTVTDDEKYTFIMPDHNVLVTVTYNQTLGDTYKATLESVGGDGSAKNTAKLKIGDTEHTEYPVEVIRQTPVKVLVERHSDYDVSVEAKTSGGDNVAVTTDVVSQEYTFNMPSSDVTVTVTYTKAPQYSARLAMDQEADGLAANAAKLSYVNGDGVTVTTDELDQIQGGVGDTGGTSTIQARDGRTMTVDLKVHSDYVATVTVIGEESGSREELTLSPAVEGSSYQYQATFEMPKENVEVRVDFKKAAVVTATLELINTDSQADNTATLKATDNRGGHTAAGQGGNITVIAGTKVTVELGVADGYKVKEVTIIRQDTGKDSVSFTGSYAGGVLEFKAPSEEDSGGVADVKVYVTYEEGARQIRKATLKLEPTTTTSKGVWDDNSLEKFPALNAEVGAGIEAKIDVEKGWYIDSVTVQSATASYPATLSGNGYNGGAGKTETISMTMPDDDILVTVALKEGPPPVTATSSVTLIVNDAANTGETPADNWAQLAIGEGACQPDGGQKKGDANTVIATPDIAPGDKVRVKVHAAAGFKLDPAAPVVIGPASAGITPTWIDGETLEFTQPDGHTTVTVNFVAGELTAEDAYTATLHMDPDAGGTATLTNTRAAAEPTIIKTTNVNNGTVQAFAGDKLTIAAEANENLFVTAVYVVDKNGAVISLTPPLPSSGGTGNQTGDFVMPAGDVDVYVEYGDVEPPEDGHTAVLTVKGPTGEGVNPGDAGSATLKFGYNDTTVTADSNGDSQHLTAIAGSTMTVEIAPQEGYGIEVVTIAPDGVAALAWTGINTVQFTMPGEDVGVVVRLVEGTGAQYTADIVMRLPDGATVEQAGDARFENGEYSIVKTPGASVPVTVAVKPGYYLDHIEITPAGLGVTAEYGGVYASETAGFTMPAGNVTVNVYIKKGWPGMSDLPVTLNVEGPEGVAGNTAAVADLAEDRAANKVGPLTAGASGATTAWDGDSVVLDVTAAENYTWTLELKDAENQNVPYTWSGKNQVTFAMPATGLTATVTFAEGTDTEHTAALSDASTTHGTLTNEAGRTDTSVAARRGETVTVTATHEDGKRLAAVPVTGASGTAVPLNGAISGDTAAFVMPDEDVTVDLIFGSADPENDGYTAVLQFSGPANAGEGILTGGDSSSSVSACPGFTVLNVTTGKPVTVKPTAKDGFVIDHIEVLSGGGTLTYTWDWSTVGFTMPAADVTVLVVFREATEEDKDGYTAQLVVDDSGDETNKVKLYTTDPAAGGDTLTGLQPGTEVTVDITVGPGSSITLVSVTPTKYGVELKPLTKPTTESQTTSFLMPAGDVIVFVQFEGDALVRYDVIMTVGHGDKTEPNNDNTAGLTTPVSGKLDPIRDGETSVGRAGNGETVTVDVTVEDGYYAVVEARDDLNNSAAVVQTGADGNKFQFTMPNSVTNVTVTFNSKENNPPARYRAYLHIAGAGDGDGASITLSDDSTITTSEDMGFIEGDQGAVVDLSATAGTNRYIKEAYVMYGAIVLDLTLPGDGRDGESEAGKTLADDFRLQAGDVHVYVAFDEEANIPSEREYAAVLTVTGPAGEAPGAAGRATMTASDDKSTGELLSNSVDEYTLADGIAKVTTPHTGVLTAAAGEQVTVDVTVEAGYELDLIVLTPLSLGLTAAPALDAGGSVIEGKYTFTMPNLSDLVPPGANVGVEVRLKEGDRENIHKVTFHLDDPSKTDTEAGVNEAKVTFGNQAAQAEGEFINVPTGSKVPITVKPAENYYVKYAYVLQDSAMVELDTPLGGYSGTEEKTAEFEMPGGDSDAYLVFAQGESPAIPEYAVVLTVTDPTNGGANKVTLSNGRTAANAPTDGKTGVTVPSDGQHYTLSALAGDKMNMVMILKDGYTVKSITVTPGGRSITPTQDPQDKNRYTFTMPAGDISILVELTTGALNTYTAALHVVDESTAIGNKVTMADGKGHTVSAGHMLTGLAGTENLRINATLQDKVKIAKVLCTTSDGTEFLDNPSGAYIHSMTAKDVTITVYLTDDPEREGDTYFVTVKKEGRDGQPDNDAVIRNTSEPGMPSGGGWAAVHEGNNAELEVTTAEGFCVKSVTAVNSKDSSAVKVIQTGEQRYILTAPAADVVVTVTYVLETEKPTPTTGSISLEISGDYGTDGVNAATLAIAEDSTKTVTVTGAATAGQALSDVPAGALLKLTTGADTDYYVSGATLTVAGREIDLTLRAGTAEFYMPELAAGETAEVTVTFAAGAQSPRPYDPDNTDNSANGYQKGWLEGENLGDGKLQITVDSLTADEGITLKDTDNAAFKLYLWNGLEQTELVRGTDYELMTDPYEQGVYYEGIQGSRFTIRSLIGGSALSEAIANGGLLYISATKGGDAESERVELVIPADTGRYTATLRIVDLSGIPGNSAEMSVDGENTVTVSGRSITDLLGTETVRTVVKLAQGARLVSVTATETSGSNLLDRSPADAEPWRYAWDMTGRNVIITVRIEAEPPENDPDGPMYQAAVVKVDDHELTGNDVNIYNTAIPTLGRGVIWSYGYEGNVMRVAVSTETGYYATVTAKEKTTGNAVPVLQSDYTVHTTGTAGAFDALVTMPAADVQITVTYSKTPPENYSNHLTLTMAGDHDSAEGNSATVTWGESNSFSVYGGTGAVTMARTTDQLPTGTQLTLKVNAAENYYVSDVTLEVQNVMSTALTPDRNGEVSFAMPYGGDATVTVTYAEGAQMPQPHDPEHTGSAVYEDGWIEAKSTVDDTQQNHQVEVTVPTLFHWANKSLSNAYAGSAAGSTDISFKLYYRDAFGKFVELEKYSDGRTGDILLSDITKVTANYDGISYDSANFTVTCLQKGGFLAEIFKQGGLLYITAVDNGNIKSESRYTELVIPANHSATLYITDNSTASGNTVSLAYESGHVTKDKESLTGLRGDENLTTTVTKQAGVEIAGVMVSDRTGAKFLEPSASAGNQYPYTMTGEDVDVFVQLIKEDDPDRLYRATVRRDDVDDLADNTASVVNTTDGTLSQGSVWTDAREGDVVEVTVSTAMGYYATVTARNVDTDTTVPVRQSVVTGDFTAQVQMPAGNVEITVTYSKDKPAPGTLTLKIMTGLGTATVSRDGAALLTATKDTEEVAITGPESVSVGTALELRATAAEGQYLKEAKLVIVLETDNEMVTTLHLTNGRAAFQMPLSNAEVRVYFESGEKTPRPYDPTHTDSEKGYTDGWLEAENQDGVAVKIGVPTLFDGSTLSNANDVTYRLYYKDALDNYRCVDGDVTISGGTEKDLYPGYTGWEFTATGNKTDTALDKILKEGGALYITATREGDGESEYTEVQVLSADQKTYTATFKVVDMAADQTSAYNLNDGKGHTVDKDGETITGLLGGEDMTTTVTKLGEHVKIQAVAMTTEAGGTVLLSAGSGADNIFDATMPAADATFTLFLEDDNLPDEEKIYIATVQTVDDTGVEGNTANIVNAADSAARKGTIWSAGQPGDDMVVSFTTGDGVYAVITATRRTEGNEPITLLQIGVTGSGKTYFDMPAANVQVTVTFTTTPPPDTELTLELAGHGGVAENTAAVYEKASADAAFDTSADPLLKLSGAANADDLLTATVTVPPGSYLKVITGHGDVHTVKSITITVTTKDGYVLELPVTDGATEVQMPLNASTITVTFQPGVETGRPYDPNHADGASSGHQDGWLEGESLGGGKAKIIVPTIGVYQEPAEGATEGTYTLQNANNHDFAIYLFNEDLGAYVKLELDKDYTVSEQKTINGYYKGPGTDDTEGTSDDEFYQGTEFVIQEVDGGKLKGLLDKGVTLYITATDKEEQSPPWTESRRTELIIPSSASGLRPYDPERVNAEGTAGTYADHWIKADNRGDYALITVPTLANESDTLYDVTEEYSFDISILESDGTYASLSAITDQIHPDGDTTTPYKLDTFYTAPASGDTPARPYTGAQFVLKLKDTAGMTTEEQDLAARVREILSGGTVPERLYIKSIKTTTEGDVTTAEESSLVDMEVGPIYTLKGRLESYAPQHAATFSFYALKDSADPTNPAGYESDPALTFEVVHDQGKRLWTLDFELKSSELPGTWMLVVTKPGHIEYRQTGIVLSADTADGTTFTFTEALALIGGDIDQDGAVTLLDREIVMAFADGSPAYTWAKTPEEDGWEDSIFNPDSLAYAADLDGDGMMSMMDLSVIMHERNYNMSQADYTASLTLQSAASPPGP